MKPKTCFIENDFVINSEMGDSILYLIEDATHSDNLVFSQLFDIIITEASNRPKEVWNAIVLSDYIFISTAFIGNSGRLLEQMCEMALRKKIKNKTIVNFRNSDSYLHMTERGQRMLHILMARNNVRYIAQDTPEFIEICKLIVP